MRMWFNKGEEKPCSSTAESRIPRLKDLTMRLSKAPGTIVFDCGTADGVSVGLKKNADVAIVDLTLPAGGIFPAHDHETMEILIVYVGEVILRTDRAEYDLGPGSSKRINKGVMHSVEAITDAKLIVITVPAAEGFPDASRD